MTIQVLVCDVDGSQQVETREVPEDYFPPLPTGEDDPPQPLTADEIPIE